MQSSTQPITPLRQRMIDDMRMRKFAPHTQAGYIRAVRKLAGFLGRSPDTASVEDLRRFQLHMVDTGPPVRFVQIRPLRSIPLAAGLCKSALTRAVGQSDSHQIA
jgi:hypothetical protein